MTGPEMYEFLREARATLQPACSQHAEHKGMQRQLRIEMPSIDDEHLTLVSYNGYDRRERTAQMSYRDLKMDLNKAFMKARDAVLVIDSMARIYAVQALADEVIKGMDIHGVGVEYDTWIDYVTDNVIVKSYRRHPRRAALGFAITRDIIMDYAPGGEDVIREHVKKHTQELADAYKSEAKLEELGAYYSDSSRVPILAPGLGLTTLPPSPH